MSLLTPQEPQGILGDLLAQFGYSMLAGKGNLGQNIGNAGLANLQYRQQQEQLQRERERQAMQDQLLGYQVKGAQRGQQEAEREDAFLQQLPGLMNRPVPGAAPTLENAAKLPPQETPYDRYMRLSQAAMAAGAKGNAAAYAKLAEQYKPKFKAENQTAFDAQGRPVILQLGEGGERQEVQGNRPYEKPMPVDLGNRMAFIDPTTVQPRGTFDVGVSPNTALTSQVTMRGQNLTDARSRDANLISSQGKVSDRTTAIRKEFNDIPEVKNYRTVVPIVESAKRSPNTPAGDLNLIYAVGKVLDPTSVVREGEMNLVIKSGSPMERFKGAVNYVMGGGRLSPELRQQLTNMLDGRVGELRSGYNSARQLYERSATAQGLPADQIFMDDRETDPLGMRGASENDPLGIRR